MTMNQQVNNVKYIKFLNALHPLINTSDTLDYWGFIPVNLKSLSYLYRIFKNGMLFVDLGCGPGNVLQYANNIGFNVEGVEIDKNFKPHLKDFKVLYEDIRNLPKDYISKFDVVYSYRPLKEGLDEFITYILANMKVGSYLILPDYPIIHKSIQEVSTYVYRVTLPK